MKRWDLELTFNSSSCSLPTFTFDFVSGSAITPTAIQATGDQVTFVRRLWVGRGRDLADAGLVTRRAAPSASFFFFFFILFIPVFFSSSFYHSFLFFLSFVSSAWSSVDLVTTVIHYDRPESAE